MSKPSNFMNSTRLARTRIHYSTCRATGDAGGTSDGGISRSISLTIRPARKFTYNDIRQGNRIRCAYRNMAADG